MSLEGLLYTEEFVSPSEERELLAEIEALDFRELSMRGQTARRTVRHFGLNYDYERGGVVPGDPLPEGLEWLRERAAGLIERDPEDLAQILVTRYPEGAGIGWHRDAPTCSAARRAGRGSTRSRRRRTCATRSRSGR